MASASVSVPEQGQLVQVRSRQWVVNEVKPSSLPALALKPNFAGPQNLLTLSSVEDDGLGEELQVVWEIEPGARVIEKVALPEPTGFDAPDKLDAFLDAVRWGAASTADLKNIQSPFRSGIEIEDYQLDPVVRAIQMPRVNLLIADDVGLGKTIEAGMVALELIIRHRARKILIVVPSSLQIQWRDQMRDKFGLEFRIVDSELMREIKYGSKHETRPRYTVSDCFQTFPFPEGVLDARSAELWCIGERYYEHRGTSMSERQEGLTRTYNRFHDPDESSADIETLRDLQVEMDKAVAAAYGWDDLKLGHGFHETKQGIRFTISEPARREVLQRLLKLNHERYAEEVKQGLHDKKKRRTKKSARKNKSAKKQQAALFDAEGDEP